MANVEHLLDTNFEEKVLKSSKPVLVDFFATWCGPCKMLGPIIEKIGEEAGGKYDVYKIDVDQSPTTAQKYGIMSIPTIIIFKNGEIAEKIVGLTQKATLEDKLNKLV